MILTLVSQNLQHGAKARSDGTPEDRWPAIAVRIGSLDPSPDFVLLQEADGWGDNGSRLLIRACNDLDLDPTPIAPSPSGRSTVLLYRRERVGRLQAWSGQYADHTTHGFAMSAFDVGAADLLTIIPVHLCFYSGSKAVVEAQLLANRAYRNGPLGILGGDFNYLPGADPEPDESMMRPYHRSMRTHVRHDGVVEHDRRVAEVLGLAEMIDVAPLIAAEARGVPSCAGTCPDYGRIDQFWVTRPLAPAVIDCQLLTEPVGASDHHGVAISIDTDQILSHESWEYH